MLEKLGEKSMGQSIQELNEKYVSYLNLRSIARSEQASYHNTFVLGWVFADNVVSMNWPWPTKNTHIYSRTQACHFYEFKMIILWQWCYLYDSNAHQKKRVVGKIPRYVHNWCVWINSFQTVFDSLFLEKMLATYK